MADCWESLELVRGGGDWGRREDKRCVPPPLFPLPRYAERKYYGLTLSGGNESDAAEVVLVASLSLKLLGTPSGDKKANSTCMG